MTNAEGKAYKRLYELHKQALQSAANHIDRSNLNVDTKIIAGRKGMEWLPTILPDETKNLIKELENVVANG